MATKRKDQGMKTTVSSYSAISSDSYKNSSFAELSAGQSFKLLTFNTWGLKYVSKFRKERLQSIANKFASDDTDYDIIALQEIWTKEDWDYLDNICATKYPFRRWFHSGIIAGPGLAILSKYPLEKTFLYRFPINGRPSAFFRGDWYVGKSLAVSILDIGNGKTIAILNSHMHAPYSILGDAAYECHRACQAWDISQIINELKRANHNVILVGDLNSRPGSLPFNIFETEAGLRDSWEVLNGKIDLELIKSMEPLEQIIRAGTTCDSTLNTWRASRRPDEACRLDYALIDQNRLKPTNASVEFTDKIPQVGSYSDHFAYSVSLKLIEEDQNVTDYRLQDRLAVYKHLKSVVQDYMKSTLLWQKYWRLTHFAISLIVAIAFVPVIIVVSFIAPWSSILFYFFGAIILATGTVNGLIGLLFGRYEQKNMQEVLAEVEDRHNYICWQINRR